MLVLTRAAGEEIVIDGTIRVKVVALHNQRVRLGIVAPASVTVDRDRESSSSGEKRPNDR